MKSFVWALRILTLSNILALERYPFFCLVALPVSPRVNSQIERVCELSEAIGNFMMIIKNLLAERNPT